MSFYTRLQFYKKDPSYIISDNTVLGIFQVDYEKKNLFEISDLSVSFYRGIQALNGLEYINLGSTYEIYHSYFDLFMFYALATGDYGETVRNTDEGVESLLFDSSRVLRGINNLIKIVDYFNSDQRKELEDSKEIDVLLELRKNLETAERMDYLVSCSTSF